jgi:hypothetical protein
MAARPSTMIHTQAGRPAAFFDAEGLVNHEFLPQLQTMNQTVYITVLQRLRDAVLRKRPHKWSSGTWLLHHDNALCHAALSFREFVAKHSIPVVPHSPYSPDLPPPPPDFFLFTRLKSTLKGKRFQDVAEIQLNTTRQLISPRRTIMLPKRSEVIVKLPSAAGATGSKGLIEKK